MSGLRYILLIGVLALLAGLYLGNDLDDEDSPARNAGLVNPEVTPKQ